MLLEIFKQSSREIAADVKKHSPGETAFTCNVRFDALFRCKIYSLVYLKFKIKRCGQTVLKTHGKLRVMFNYNNQFLRNSRKR